jgi:hypothetical protein
LIWNSQRTVRKQLLKYDSDPPANVIKRQFACFLCRVVDFLNSR